jgi:tRNA threonylcarbamoyladenosine biosynthesis protein TsaE
VDKKYALQVTTNYKQTQKLGAKFAKEILLSKTSQKNAVVVALSGNLGGGKTTFLQGFAKGLGVKEKILSPTYVIMKKFVIPAKAGIQFFHFDCYRLNKPEDILELGFEKIISNPKNIIAVEWPEKIKKVLPKNIIKINFKFIDENIREISFGNNKHL